MNRLSELLKGHPRPLEQSTPGMKGIRGCRGVAEHLMASGERRRGLCQLPKGHEGDHQFAVVEWQR